MEILECLCDRAGEKDESFKRNTAGNLKAGLERTCKVENGKGSCGEGFYEDNGEPCRWCCQVIKTR